MFEEITKAKKQMAMSKRIAELAAFFWIAETITFLLIEGWHYRATHPVEQTCDTIVIILVIISVVYYVRAINCMFNKWIKDNDYER